MVCYFVASFFTKNHLFGCNFFFWSFSSVYGCFLSRSLPIHLFLLWALSLSCSNVLTSELTVCINILCVRFFPPSTPSLKVLLVLLLLLHLLLFERFNGVFFCLFFSFHFCLHVTRCYSHCRTVRAHTQMCIGCGIFIVLCTRYCIHILCALCTLIYIASANAGALNVIFFVEISFLFFSLPVLLLALVFAIHIHEE